MANKNQQKITLEDLLKVKRLEQPDAAFWETFDLRLKEKTLQAIVQKTPWYKRFSIQAWEQLKPITPAFSAAMIMFVLFFQTGIVSSHYGLSSPHSELAAPSQRVLAMQSSVVSRDAHFVKNVIDSSKQESSFVKVFAAPALKSNTSLYEGGRHDGRARSLVAKASL